MAYRPKFAPPPLIHGGIWDERWSIGHDLHHCDGVNLIKTLCKTKHIILKANQGSDVSFDVRDAESYSLSESKKMEGGATSRQLQIGDKVAVPIYR